MKNSQKQVGEVDIFFCSPFFSRSFPTAPRSCPDSPVLAPFSSRSFQVYAKILPDSQPLVPRSIRSCHVLVPIEPRPIRLGPDCATFSPRLNQFFYYVRAPTYTYRRFALFLIRRFVILQSSVPAFCEIST